MQEGQRQALHAVGALAVAGRRGHILLVDDEALVTEVGREMLTDLGYEVTACTSGAQALEVFRRTPHAFVLAIVDYALPDLSGAALAQALRQLRPHLPLILCTSQVQTHAQAHALGFDALLRKPFRLEHLALTLDVVLA
ncbi:MAG: hypothetical protein KatS3mg131_3306 [Candidatus Tectimicrobiota bacterium]|nr:MAG: hypothetical protein KatS3mg131_3306 [Candidatus Tectomicrobia bacterium]